MEAIAYNLVVDKDIDNTIHILLEVCNRNGLLGQVNAICAKHGSPDGINKLIDAISDKSHETFGCSDPTCTWEPKK